MSAVATPPIHSEIRGQLREVGVAWMNRGHALMLQGDPASLAASLAAYNEAISLLRHVELARNPSAANSLGAALMNRGQLLHRLHGVEQAVVALAAFAEAAQILRELPADENPWPRRNLTGTLVNRANLLLDLSQFTEAAEVAREALIFAAPHEQVEVVDADLALKARRGLADALGQLLVTPGADQDALAREASDLVDDALALVRGWTACGERSFRPLADRFFHYGTQLYRQHQPHFLAEFIEENIDDHDHQFRATAVASIDAVLQERPRDGEFLTIGDPLSERRRQTWQELAALRDRLVT
jgi:tetratricopeptide (TPR) repeat protein